MSCYGQTATFDTLAKDEGNNSILSITQIESCEMPQVQKEKETIITTGHGSSTVHGSESEVYLIYRASVRALFSLAILEETLRSMVRSPISTTSPPTRSGLTWFR